MTATEPETGPKQVDPAAQSQAASASPVSELPQRQGLSPVEAARRLTAEGPNLLPGSTPKSTLVIVREVLIEPMFLMLLAAGGIYLALGDRAEAIFLLGFVFVVIGITLAQERKTQRALVIRGGQSLRIAGREVVRGDVLVLREGDRIAADALLLQGRLEVDESAVEALGAITVLAVDKTGTLTLNRMAVAELATADAHFTPDGADGLPEEFHTLTEFAMLATPGDPFDPMKKAIQSFGQHWLANTEHVHEGRIPEFEYALSGEILAMTRVFASADPSQHLLATKGAPEAVAALCHLNSARINAIRSQVEAMAERSLRVLGVLAPNPWLWRMAVAMGLLLAAVLGIAWLQNVMGLTLPGIEGLAVGLGLLALCGVWLELVRRVDPRRRNLNNQQGERP